MPLNFSSSGVAGDLVATSSSYYVTQKATVEEVSRRTYPLCVDDSVLSPMPGRLCPIINEYVSSGKVILMNCDISCGVSGLGRDFCHVDTRGRIPAVIESDRHGVCACLLHRG